MIGPSQDARVSASGAVGDRARPCLAPEKPGRKFHLNRMMFPSLAVSSGWRYGYFTVWMHRSVEGQSLCIPEKFGRDRTLYGEVTST